jgi:hypothetical protein
MTQRGVVEVVVDVGKPGGAFAWVHTHHGELAVVARRTAGIAGGAGSGLACGRRQVHWPHECLSCLASFLDAQLRQGPVSLGMEAPLLVPLPTAKASRGEVTLHPRPIEEPNADRGLKHRGWYYGAGAATLTQVLLELTYLFGELGDALTAVTTDPDQDPAESEQGPGRLFIWEAFVTQVTFEMDQRALQAQLRKMLQDDYSCLPLHKPERLAATAKDVAAAILALRARLAKERILYPSEGAGPRSLNVVEQAAMAADVAFDGPSSRIAIYRSWPDSS